MPADTPRGGGRLKEKVATLQQLSQESGLPYTSIRDFVIQGHLTRVTLGDSRRIFVKRAEWNRFIAQSLEGR